MLGDERSSEFVNGFLDSWLNLRDIGNLPPPRKAAPEYYAENLPESMKQEARRFFRNLLEENGSVTDFLGRRLHLRRQETGQALSVARARHASPGGWISTCQPG